MGRWTVQDNLILGAAIVAFYVIKPTDDGPLGKNLGNSLSRFPVDVLQQGQEPGREKNSGCDAAPDLSRHSCFSDELDGGVNAQRLGHDLVAFFNRCYCILQQPQHALKTQYLNPLIAVLHSGIML
jgi:hypothetical protein